MIIRKDFPLAPILWYKIGGTAKYFLGVQDKEDVFRAFDFVEKNRIKRMFVIGFGSNLLFTDEYFDGAVIRIVREKNNLIQTTKDGLVEAFAGEELDRLIKFAFDHNLIGLEWAGGLPGTVGAAVRGNVGAFGAEIKDSFYEAEILEINGDSFDMKKMNNRDMNFSYRNSSVKQNRNLLILSSQFQLRPVSSGDLEKARQTYQANIDYRNTHHPLNYPNCGSVFKNIVKKEQVEKILAAWPDIKEKSEKDWHGKVAMGYIVKRLGFSDLKIGNAKVSERHANFIVNLGGAKFRDVLQIIKAIEEKFQETFGFRPELEVEIVR